MPVLGPIIVARNVDGIDGIYGGYGGVGIYGCVTGGGAVSSFCL